MGHIAHNVAAGGYVNLNRNILDVKDCKVWSDSGYLYCLDNGKACLIYNNDCPIKYDGNGSELYCITHIESGATIEPDIIAFIPKYHYYNGENVINGFTEPSDETDKFAMSSNQMFYYNKATGELITRNSVRYYFSQEEHEAYEDAGNGVLPDIVVEIVDNNGNNIEYTIFPPFPNIDLCVEYKNIELSQVDDLAIKYTNKCAHQSSEIDHSKIAKGSAILAHELFFTNPDKELAEHFNKIFTRACQREGGFELLCQLFPCIVENKDNSLMHYKDILMKFKSKADQLHLQFTPSPVPITNVRADILAEIRHHREKASKALAALESYKEDRKKFNEETEDERELLSQNKKIVAELVKASLVFHKPFVFRLLQNPTELKQAAIAAKVDIPCNLRQDEKGCREVLYIIYGNKTDRRRISEYAKALVKARDWSDEELEDRLSKQGLTAFVKRRKPLVEEDKDTGEWIFKPLIGEQYRVEEVDEDYDWRSRNAHS